MRYEGTLYRPPSEARSYILQATIGCSWNHCTYCDMYRGKKYRVRDLQESLDDIAAAGQTLGPRVHKVFVADGDALGMDMAQWKPLLAACHKAFPNLRRVSAYATARNLNQKTSAELKTLRSLGLSMLYIGPESGDDITLKRLAKGADFAEHVSAAKGAKSAEIALSSIFLLGAGGVARSHEHAQKTAELITEMDPEFVSLLTLTILPGTPIAKQATRGDFEVPDVERIFGEIRTIVAKAAPTNAVFRTNHASNYLPLGGNLPADRDQIVRTIDRALNGDVALRPEWMRGL